MINEGNEIRSSLRCEQPPELRGKLFLELDPPTFCTTPLVLKLAIQDIQPFSVVVSWQSRNHSGVYGYQVAYNAISAMDYNASVSVLLFLPIKFSKDAEFPATFVVWRPLLVFNVLHAFHDSRWETDIILFRSLVLYFMSTNSSNVSKILNTFASRKVYE